MKFLFAATAALSLVAIAAPQATAQNAAGANASQYGIAVIDVSYVFKNHAQFRQTMDGMKKEMQQIEQQLEAEKKKIMAMEEELKTLNPGTPDFKSKDDKLATAKAQFQLNMTRLRKGFLEKEANAYYKTYQEVSQAIAYYAKQRKIGVVLRFNGDSADPAQRDQILRDINKPVQFQDSLDITPDILAMLNRNAGGATGAGGQATRPARPAGTSTR